MNLTRLKLPLRGLSVIGLLSMAACSQVGEDISGLDPNRLSFAMQEVETLQSRGARVWCVPFARNASGIDIFGDARTWWSQAKERFHRSEDPHVGSVMSFTATRSMPLGHVAVVSEVISDREMRVDHANWHRNKVSLGMRVVDVSKDNDWSRVRLESNPGALGSVYPVNGFILPNG